MAKISQGRKSMPKRLSQPLATFGLAACATLGASLASAEQTVTMWSHWPDELAKRNYIEARVKEFEAANAQCKVKLTFTQKSELYTSAKAAVRTGSAPDIF